jgi:hypothetical protein
MRRIGSSSLGEFPLDVVRVDCQRCGRAGSYRRDGLVARFVILCLCGTLVVGLAAHANAEDTPRERLAEMVAIIRLAEPCDGVVQGSPEYVTEALSLLMVVDPRISEEIIEAKEEVVKNSRAKLGLAKRCQFYAVEVSEAKTLAKLMLDLGR